MNMMFAIWHVCLTWFASLLLLLPRARGAVSVSVSVSYSFPDVSQTFRVYNGFSIGFASGANATNSSVRSGAPAMSCALLCLATPNCYAATLIKSNSNSSGMCSLQQNCAHVVLRSDSHAATYVISRLQSVNELPVIDLPLVYACNLYSNFGTGSLSLPTYLNYAQDTSKSANGNWPGAASTLTFTTASTSSISSTAFLLFTYTVNYSFDVLTASSNFTISFYYKSTSRAAQVVFLITKDYNTAGSHCFVALHESCGSSFCLSVYMFKDCNGMVSNKQTAMLVLRTGYNDWKHVTISYDRGSARFSGYVNGNLTDWNSVSFTGSIKATQLAVASGSLYSLQFMNFISSFAGSIYCFQIFKSALNQNQVIGLQSVCENGGVFTP